MVKHVPAEAGIGGIFSLLAPRPKEPLGATFLYFREVLLCGKQLIQWTTMDKQGIIAAKVKTLKTALRVPKTLLFGQKQRINNISARSSARIEHRFPKPGVRGSSPLGRISNDKDFGCAVPPLRDCFNQLGQKSY